MADAYINKTNQTGFTLLEVIVSFTIMSLSLAFMYGIINNSTQSTLLAHEYVYAASIAQSQIGLPVSNNIRADQNKGIVQNKYHWTRQIVPSNSMPKNQQSPIKPYDIVVTVRWNNKAKTHYFSISTVKLLAHAK